MGRNAQFKLSIHLSGLANCVDTSLNFMNNNNQLFMYVIIQNTIDRKTSWAEVGKQCTTLQKQMYKYALCVQFCDLRTPCGSIFLSVSKGRAPRQ